MKAYIQVITAVDNEEKAHEIARFLLEKRVAACVQIIPISSMYRWKGKIEKSREWLCLIKGKDFEKIESVIKKIHPYETPEIIEIPITQGNKKYLDWIDEETS
ncbi:MAG: divalent-cation tolerance protein CutA [Nanoarchaeota archaeon]|nr:divalent-cation tolerance protein CutA [Nanoarchaeota archaeon]